jgi:hypothetical protein
MTTCDQLRDTDIVSEATMKEIPIKRSYVADYDCRKRLRPGDVVNLTGDSNNEVIELSSDDENEANDSEKSSSDSEDGENNDIPTGSATTVNDSEEKDVVSSSVKYVYQGYI